MSDEKTYLDWGGLEAAVYMLSRSMQDNGDVPDAIVGISRGGLPGAVMMSHALEVPLATIHADYYDGTEKKGNVEVGEFDHLPDGDVIVFDDIVDSGETMEQVIEIVEEMATGEVYSAAINVKPDRSFDPDYWIEQTESWVVYPWEVSI